MLIRVRLPDNQIRRVPACELEKLICSGDIVAFERSSGWIEVDAARLRKTALDPERLSASAEDRERRAAQAYLQLLRQVDDEDTDGRGGSAPGNRSDD